MLLGDANVSPLLRFGMVGVFLATQPTTIVVLRLADELRTGFLVALADSIVRVAVLGIARIAGGGMTAVVAASVAGAAVHGIGMMAARVPLAPKAGITGPSRRPGAAH